MVLGKLQQLLDWGSLISFKPTDNLENYNDMVREANNECNAQRHWHTQGSLDSKL